MATETELYETPLLVDVEEITGSCGLCTTGGGAAAEMPE